MAEDQVEESQAAINFNHLKQVVVDAEERQVRAEVPDDSDSRSRIPSYYFIGYSVCSKSLINMIQGSNVCI